MSDDILIRCENVGKKFCRDLKKSLWYGVTDSISELFGNRRTRRTTSESTRERRVTTNDFAGLRDGEFWANKDISFELKRGECLALIGRNGAGKTTLLKMLSGLVKPDAGRIELHGQVRGMIALGAGFNPILTGRENIYVNGAILGLSKRQIEDQIEKITIFSELSASIDSPVRTYSSGMQVRLGYATAVSLIQPDILLLDEVLAVGDVGFTIKCLNSMRNIANRCAVVFVTHTMQYVSAFCTHALLMEQGRAVKFSTDTGVVMDRYLQGFSQEQTKTGIGGADIHSLSLTSPGAGDECDPNLAVPHGARVFVHLTVSTSRAATIRIAIRSQNLIPIMASKVEDRINQHIILEPGSHRVCVDLGPMDLNAGIYPVAVSLESKDTREILTRVDGAASIRVCKDIIEWGLISRPFYLAEGE
jgi:lipopolysaccharide transport system ATP-binding protein